MGTHLEAMFFILRAALNRKSKRIKNGKLPYGRRFPVPTYRDCRESSISPLVPPCWLTVKVVLVSGIVYSTKAGVKLPALPGGASR